MEELLSKNCFILNYTYTVLAENCVQISLLGTDVQNFGEVVRLILYNIYSFEKYERYQKMLFSKTVFFFTCLNTKFCGNQFAG